MVILQGQMYVGDYHMPAAEGFPCQASVRGAVCHVCVRGMQSRVVEAARACVSVSSPSRALEVVVSHGLSLQRQLSCSFPPNSPLPALHHPPQLQDLCHCFSLPSPCPAQLLPGGCRMLPGRESPTSAGPALQFPVLSHCLSAQVTRGQGLFTPPSHLCGSQGFHYYGEFSYSPPIPSLPQELLLFLCACLLFLGAGCPCLLGP